MKEQCPHCHNIVVGQFTPSDTRRWLTSLAKKGGMKAVLTAAGSVVPGFGNVSGFLAGTAIDVIYGKDINKLVDKVADAFDDNKIYVFTCPNCGHTWTRKEDDFDEDYEDIQSSVAHTSSTSSNNPHIEQFNRDFDYFLEHIDGVLSDAKETEHLGNLMKDAGIAMNSYDESIASQYFFLAGMCYLLYGREHYYDTDTAAYLKRAKVNLERAIDIIDDDEYKLMLAATKNLLCTTPQQCIILGDSFYTFENGTLFKEEWLIETYESCRFKSLIMANDLIRDSEGGEYNDDMAIKLWKSGLNLRDKDYCMVSNLKLFLINDELTPAGKMTVTKARYLNSAYHTDGYAIETCDTNNGFDREWLTAAIYYAKSIIEDTNPFYARNINQGVEILNKIAALDKCNPVIFACCQLAEYYEEGIVVEKNISKALSYYKKAGLEEDVTRLMNASKNQNKIHSSNTKVQNDAEAEYAEEVKACFEDGVISKGERRLLDRLRSKLGISESRAAEIEASLLQPQLTEAEQEYLAEYKECFAAGGVISAGERRLLNRLRDKLGISEERAMELEK